MMSICGTMSNYNHVIVVWKNQIIDFESETTFPLTVSNLNYCCGSSSVFLGVDRGYGIIPSKKIKLDCSDLSDWGENEIQSNIKYMFKTK